MKIVNPGVAASGRAATRTAVAAILALALAACGADSTAQPAASATTGAAPADPTADRLARGRAVYLRECAACHGERGEGQPDWAIQLPDGSMPASPHDSSGHTWHHSDAELLDIVTRGGTFYLPASTMPAFASKLSTDDMRAALAHIKTFWGPEEAAYQAEMTAQEQLRRSTQQAGPTVATP